MIKNLNTPEKYSAPTLYPAMQFLVYAAIITGALIVGTFLGLGVAVACYGVKIFTALSQLDATAPHFITAMWIVQLFSMTLPILIAPIIFSWFVVKNATGYLKSGVNFSWLLLLLVFGIMMAAFPLVEFLSNVNHMIPPPHFLEQWVKDTEKNAEKVTTAFLQMDTIWQMLLNLVFIGLLTAIAEEFMFRGVLQTIFEKWMKNKHAAIWVTAIIFSAFHLEFFGFLPRIMLGAILGYFVVYSGSIWPAIFGHFVNNGTDVVLTYLSQHKLTNINPDDEHVFNSTIYVLSTIIILFLLYVYRYTAAKKPVQV